MPAAATPYAAPLYFATITLITLTLFHFAPPAMLIRYAIDSIRHYFHCHYFADIIAD